MNRIKDTTSVALRHTLETRYDKARAGLLLLTVFTLLNMSLVLLGQDLFFLFSASLPYQAVYLGMYRIGKLPDEVYGAALKEMEFSAPSFLIAQTVAAVVLTALFFLCWIRSARRSAYQLTLATLLLAADTVYLIKTAPLGAQTVIDLMMHALILFYLLSGIVAAMRLSHLSKTEQDQPASDDK